MTEIETFDQKLMKVAGTIRQVVMDDPQRRYSGGLMYYANKAEGLRNSALALGGDPFSSHFEAFALLAGYSLEVLIKGILAGLDEKIPHTHNLVTLSERAGFALHENDRAVLTALTVYTTWYSRYPSAKTSREMTAGLATLEAQYPRSGNLGVIAKRARSSPSAVNEDSYERLYTFFVQRFFELYSSVYESAVFSFELPDG
jgi:hypothetical protein